MPIFPPVFLPQSFSVTMLSKSFSRSISFDFFSAIIVKIGKFKKLLPQLLSKLNITFNSKLEWSKFLMSSSQTSSAEGLMPVQKTACFFEEQR